jgi:hypothetical protein
MRWRRTPGADSGIEDRRGSGGGGFGRIPAGGNAVDGGPVDPGSANELSVRLELQADCQRQATGRIDRESFTHGSSQERREWFLRGFEEGTTAACDTFA